MFTKKKEEKKEGFSFPFIENNLDSGVCRVKYDSIKIVNDGKYTVITYMQGDVPFYAHTYKNKEYSEVTLKGSGEIVIGDD